MRSLYTDDITGTRSRVTIFQKSIFKEKYDHFSKSNEKNPQHKKYEWYVPVKKQRIDSIDSKPRYTLKLMSQHTGISRSGHFDQLKKIQETDLLKSKVENSSMISSSNRTSIGQISHKKGLDNNPYFPHRYQDYKQSKTKWSGNREWHYEKPQKLQLPNITKSKLIAYI